MLHSGVTHGGFVRISPFFLPSISLPRSPKSLTTPTLKSTRCPTPALSAFLLAASMTPASLSSPIRRGGEAEEREGEGGEGGGGREPTTDAQEPREKDGQFWKENPAGRDDRSRARW